MKNEQIDNYRHSKPRESLYLWALSKGSLMPNPLPLMNKASWFVLELHKGEERDDGSNYSGHPSRSCRTALNFGVTDDATLAGTLLHDTREHKKTTDKQLRIDYNDEVADIVDDVTKKDDESIEDWFKRIAKMVKSVLVKGFDRLDNLSTMVGTFTIPQIKRYSDETRKYILPMLENARHVHIEYSDILVALRDEIERVLDLIDAYIEEAEEKETYKQALIEHNIPLPEIKRIEAMPRETEKKPEPLEQAIKPGSVEDEAQKRRTTSFIPLVKETKTDNKFTPLSDTVEHLG